MINYFILYFCNKSKFGRINYNNFVTIHIKIKIGRKNHNKL